MKQSNYNFFLPYEPDDSKLIAYNSFSNALALMERAQYNKFIAFAQDGVTIDDAELIAQLKAGAFIVEDDCNELDRLRLRMLKSRYNTNYLSLTITPTADCNFRCGYCYEKDVIKTDYMTQETEDAIIKLVERQIKTIASLRITWYGGEPLMHMGAIERLSEKFIALCENNDVAYSANIITNGYLLTKEIAQRMNALKIANMQITLDGDKQMHDQRRPLTDGSGTFDTIINNLETYKDLLPMVSLRINTDKTNIDAGKKIAKIIADKGLADKVKPYLGRIIEDDNSLDVCGFSQEEFKYINELTDDDTYMRHFPQPKHNYCSADSLNAYIVAADGRLYKCWREVGEHKKCVGSLVEHVAANEPMYMDYMLFDPTMDGQCSKCNLLPVCMGSCPKDRHNGAEKCSTHKFVLDGLLDTVVRRLKTRQVAE